MPDANPMAQHWAAAIQRGAPDEQVFAIIDAINVLTAAGNANRAALMVAAAQLLAQSITAAPRNIAPDIRAGIMVLIDGFAMQFAVDDEDER